MTLPEIAVKRPTATLMVLVSILVLGVIALVRLELAFMPEAEQKNLYVIAEYKNASPKAIERMIVKPLEDSLASMNGLEHMWSRSNHRGGRVNLNFGYEVDMDLARAEIHERIDRIKNELPEDLERIIVADSRNPRESGETIMEARLSSGRDLSQNYELLNRKIVKPLERIPGVAVVVLDGINPREIRVNLDLNRLRQHNINVIDVWKNISQNNQNNTLGIIRNTQTKATLRSLGALTSIEEIRQLPLPDSDLKLSDVASITYKEPPLEYGRHLDGDFAIALNVAKESTANTVAITNAVRERIELMKSDPELDGINFLVWQDQGKEIKNTLNDLKQTGFFGAILATFVLFLFLRKIVTTFVAVFCIPFSLVVACGVIWIQGKTLNTISLLGLIVGLGMLVDNAVVIMENIDRFQKKGYSGRVAAILGSKEVATAVVMATLTSIIVFLPMVFSKPNSMNIVLQELGLTICITLVASLLISQTLIPLASTRLLKNVKNVKNVKDRDVKPLMDRLQSTYTGLLSLTLKHRWIAVVTSILIAGSVWYPISQINFNFEAAPTEMYIGIRLDLSEALSLSAKEKVITQVEEALAPHKDELNVKSIYAWWSGGNSVVRLYMKSGFQHEAAMNKVRKKLPRYLPEIAGVKLQVQDNGPFWKRNSGKRVGVRLQGPDTETLEKIANEAIAKIESIRGLFDFYSTAEGGTLELQAVLDREKMADYGVDSQTLARRVEMTFRGRRLPRFQGEHGEVNMQLMLGEEQETSIADVKNLMLANSLGADIPLDSLSHLEISKGPRRINRQNKISSIWVGARFEKGIRKAYRKQMIQLLKSLPLPEGYQWQFKGRQQNAEENQTEFLLNLLLALGLIFAVMASLFESMRQAIALMISLPFALAGAFWTLYLFEVDFDQPASVALLLLLGIVVNNGIVMIEHINLYRREGWQRYPAMIRGGKERLRPIIMTALTTLVGLIPIVIQKPSLGGVYYYSMAYVIMGGLLISTLLTTILLPVTISLVEDGGSFLVRQIQRLRVRTA